MFGIGGTESTFGCRFALGTVKRTLLAGSINIREFVEQTPRSTLFVGPVEVVASPAAGAFARLSLETASAGRVAFDAACSVKVL